MSLSNKPEDATKYLLKYLLSKGWGESGKAKLTGCIVTSIFSSLHLFKSHELFGCTFIDFLCFTEHQFCRVVLPAWDGEEGAPLQTLRGLRDDTENCLLTLTRNSEEATNPRDEPALNLPTKTQRNVSFVTRHEAFRINIYISNMMSLIWLLPSHHTSLISIPSMFLFFFR